MEKKNIMRQCLMKQLKSFILPSKTTYTHTYIRTRDTRGEATSSIDRRCILRYLSDVAPYFCPARNSRPSTTCAGQGRSRREIPRTDQPFCVRSGEGLISTMSCLLSYCHVFLVGCTEPVQGSLEREEIEKLASSPRT